MRLSILSIAPFLLFAAAVALPAPEAEVAERAAAIPKAWEIAPAAFKTVPAVTALHTKPASADAKGGAVKREAEADALEERQAAFNYILTYVLPYTTYPNTYYYLPYVYNTCFSFAGSNLDNVLSAVNILNTSIYCYFFVDYTCGYSDGYSYTTYANTPMNANVFQDNQWSSYICY